MAQASWLQPTTLNTEIQHLQHEFIPTADVGIQVIDAKTGKPLYQQNVMQPFSPASNTKLLTAAAALYRLGEHYRYHTYFASRKHQPIVNHTLHGNLYLKFSGDPTLSIHDLDLLLQHLHRQKHLNLITGNLLLDSSRFQGSNFALGTVYADQYWDYDAPISALMINANQMMVTLAKTNTLHQLIKVNAWMARHHYIQLLPGKLYAVSYLSAMHNCQLIVHNRHNILKLSGCWPLTLTGTALHLSIADPYYFAQRVLIHLLQKNHIHLQGHILLGLTPKRSDILAAHHSAPLSVLLRFMLKHSDNIYAESLTKTLGYVLYGKGTFTLGTKAIRYVITHKTGIDFSHAVLTDGAGLSTYNLLTPAQISRVLYVIYHDPKLLEIYKALLPLAGKDGTLVNRLQSVDTEGMIQAKTGSMHGVSTLSGYLTTRTGKQLIFSIMLNHLTTSLKSARTFQDQLLQRLVDRL